MRILLLANEHVGFQQIGFRRPLENLKSANLIDEVLVLSPQLRIETGATPTDVASEILLAFSDLRPDVVLIMHPHKMALSQKLFLRMREVKNFRLIVWEGDAYSLIRKQPSFSDIVAARNADVVFTVGKGMLEKNFKLYGARDVRWIPHCFESDRLHSADSDSLGSNVMDCDVAVIANKSLHRYRPAPGWRLREKFIHLCEAEFGQNLAVYGSGWSGPSARGPIEFGQQSNAIIRAKITANWDHYPQVPWYFSNRLPISLATGSIHATTFHAGYEHIFPREETGFLITSLTPEDLIANIKSFLLSKSQEEMFELRLAAKAFAHKNFRQDDWIVRMLNFDAPRVNFEAARLCWSV